MTNQEQNLKIVQAYMEGYPVFWADRGADEWYRVNADHIFDFNRNTYKEGDLIRSEFELLDANDNVFRVNYGQYPDDLKGVEKLLGIDSPSEGTITLSLSSLQPLIDALDKLENVMHSK